MNAPVAAKYQVQVSSTGSFTTKYDEEAEDNSSADYIDLEDVYPLCKANVPTASIATALAKLNKWDEDQVPAEQKVSMRVRAFVQDASKVTLSEVTSATAYGSGIYLQARYQCSLSRMAFMTRRPVRV